MLDGLLAAAGLPVSGGTSLFRYLETPFAQAAFEALGQAGILARRFDDLPHALRFGLPAGEPERRRLAAAFRNVAFSANATTGDVIASAAE
jgi:cobalamin biosynthetic protein CobC